MYYKRNTNNTNPQKALSLYSTRFGYDCNTVDNNLYRLMKTTSNHFSKIENNENR